MRGAIISGRINLSNYVRPLRRVAAYARAPRRLTLVAAWLALSCLPALAQNSTPNIQYTTNATDSKLRGELKVNPSTLALEFQLPIAVYPGRAGLDVPVTVSYSSKVWRIAYQGYNPGSYGSDGVPVGDGYTILTAMYGEYSRAGWTGSLSFPVIDTWSSNDTYDQSGGPTPSNGACPNGCYSVDRILARMPDGSAHELRSGDQPVAYNGTTPDDYYAVDGSRMRYQRSTGTLFMPDGSRYLIGSAQYVDRNGNTLTYAGGVTDTLGRNIPAPPLAAAAGDYTYTPPGMTGSYTFRWRTLDMAGVMTTSQPPAYISDAPCPGFPGNYTPRLFTAGVTGNCYGNATSVFKPVVLYQVTLPTNQSYTFTYNVYGEIDKAQLPTGGYERYQYGPVSGVSSGQPPYTQPNRGVVKRWVSESGSGADEALWQYSDVGATVSITPPDNSLVERRQYMDTPMGGAFGYSADGARVGLAYDERYYSAPDASGVRHMLRRRLTDWAVTGSNATAQFTSAQQYASRNPRMTKQVEILLDTGGDALAKTTTYGYDLTYQFSTGVNQTSVKEYDYVAVDQNTAQTGPISSIPTPAQPLRITETAYLDSDASYRARNLLGLPTSVTVRNGATAVVAKSTTSYDESLYQLGATYGAVTHWAAPPGARGNATTVSRWLDTTNSYVQTHAQYDQCGGVVGSWDANNNETQVDYSSAYAYAYPTTVTTPAPDPDEVSYTSAGTLYKFQAGAFGSTVGLSAFTSYDPDTGLVTSTTDANGNTTTYEYNDPLGRLTKESRPDGGWTTYQYGTNQYGDYVHTSTLLNSSGTATHAYNYTDGLGRTYRTFSNDPTDSANPWLTTDTQYDAMGRVWRVLNPYRSTGSAADINPTGRWTTTAYDALGRVKSVTTPDGAAVTTSYTGNGVTVTEQAGKKRSSVSDALGRLTQVTEDPSTGGLNYVTNYTYDALDNLRKVDQGGQLRFFMYDSFSRLRRAKNPEQAAGSAVSNITDAVTGNSQWSMAYGYDADGNLTTRIDARGVTTIYTYDHLNRNIITYYTPPAGSGVASTPDVRRYYDNSGAGENGLGRLYWTQAVGVTASVFDAYDALGRPTQFRQNFWVSNAWGQPFGVAYSYDKAGNLASQTYPSGRTVSYGYDAAGGLTSFAGNLGDGVQRSYSTGVSYDELGGIRQEQFGTETPLYHKLHYNVRGQLYDVRLSTVAWATDQWSWNRGALVNCYSTAELTASAVGRALSGPDNNGNVRRSYAYAPFDAAGSYTTGSTSPYAFYQDDYSYDSLNRLASVTETAGTFGGTPSTAFKQAYAYDRFGNRKIDAAATSNAPEPQFELSPATNREVPEPSNRLYAPGDSARAPSQKLMRYDASGNLTYDSYTGQGSRSYDAENRMTQAQDVYQNSSAYTYDGDGRRVKRNTAGQEWWQVYGPGGELLAEYQSGAAPMAATKEYGYRGGELLVTMSSGDDERVERFVQNLYYGALQRDPTAQELTDQSNQLAAAGVQGQAQLLQKAKDMARALFTQTSYETSPARSDAQYVTDLYYAYTQRGPDSSGLSFWAGKVATDGRSSVCNGFEASSEFAALVSTLYGAATSDDQRTDHFVNDFYLAAYGRNATSTELQQQRDALDAAAAQGQSQVQAQAEAMGRSLFAAQVSDFSITAQQYVTNLYEGFLQRGPDASGLSFWTTQAGTTSAARQNVLNAFAVSTAARELSGTLYRETFWLVTDHLGTPRMVADKSGSLAGVKRHDYFPFGEEIAADSNWRTSARGYVGDNVRQKFTGYERDSETSLDYAKARYFGSAIGRFTSVDPLLASAKATQPQSWNRYTYALNNPLLLVDPNGLVWAYTTSDGGRVRHYDWYSNERDVPTRATVLKNPGDFYVEGEFNGNRVGIQFNPNGPKSWLKVGLELDSGFALTGQHGDYYDKGYAIVPTRAQHAAYMRTGAIEPDYAFQFAATGLFTAGLSAASTAGSQAADRALFGQSAGRYFFTDGMEEAATAAARAEGGRTLNMAPAGRALTWLDGKAPDVLTGRLWNWGSRQWASGASGDVPFFSRGFPNNPGSAFVKDELPNLYQNPNVQSVTPRTGP
jgi:RHS repeat-associated protein